MFRQDLPSLVKLHSDKAAEVGANSEAFFCPSHLHANRLEAAHSLVHRSASSFVDVLDIGCGHGDMARKILEKRPHASYLGVDPVQVYLDRAFQHPNVAYRLGGLGDHLPVKSVVLCLGVAAYLSQSQDALNWFANSLKGYVGERLIVSWHDRSRYNGMFSSWTPEMLSIAFGEPVDQYNTVRIDGDSEAVTLFTYA